MRRGYCGRCTHTHTRSSSPRQPPLCSFFSLSLCVFEGRRLGVLGHASADYSRHAFRRPSAGRRHLRCVLSHRSAATVAPHGGASAALDPSAGSRRWTRANRCRPAVWRTGRSGAHCAHNGAHDRAVRTDRAVFLERAARAVLYDFFYRLEVTTYIFIHI